MPDPKLPPHSYGPAFNLGGLSTYAVSQIPKPDEPEPRRQKSPSAVRAILDDPPIHSRPIVPASAAAKEKNHVGSAIKACQASHHDISIATDFLRRKCQESGDQGLKTMPRKIIQIACIYDTGDDAWDEKPSEYRPHPILFGLADDGSRWMLRTPGESIGNAVRLLDSDAQTARRLSSIGGMPRLIRQTRTKG
jgi:hypothetical protein